MLHPEIPGTDNEISQTHNRTGLFFKLQHDNRAFPVFQNTTLMFIGGMTVAVAIEDWEIHKRIALKILLIMGSKPVWYVYGLLSEQDIC